MKKVLLLLTMLLSFGIGHTQTDSTCFVFITYEATGGAVQLTAHAFNLNNPSQPGNFEYSWSTGATTQSIPFPGPGTYCVTATSLDSFACTVETCITVEAPRCDIYTWLNLNGTLTAQSTGLPPFTYNWSTGDTTGTIQVNDGETYCLTLTDASGCVDDTCIVVDYTGIDTLCYAEIFVNGTNTGQIELSAFSFIDIIWPPQNDSATYLWSTGETTQSILVDSIAEYCVTVTSGICEVDVCIDLSQTDCDVFIGCDPPGHFTAFGTGIPPFRYEWSTGDTSISIPVTAGETYCVTVTDALGCVTDTCMTADSVIIWPPDTLCFAFIDVRIDSGISLTANYFDLGGVVIGNAIYEWSTGETSQTISGNPGETYCVTVTSSNTNCVATECITVENFDCSEVHVFCDPDGTVGVFSFGVPPFTYVWNTGDTTPFIQGINDSTYCVTITDAVNCVVDTCVTSMVDTTNNGDDSQIIGEVFYFDSTQNFPVLEGWVYLYKRNANAEFDLIDSSMVNTGGFFPGYVFAGVEGGEYITKAVVNDLNSGDAFVPTYHYSSMLWTEADIINIPPQSPGGPFVQYFAPIELLGVEDDLDGPGSIDGVLNDTDDLMGGSSRDLEGIANATIILTDQSDQSLAYVMTDEEGKFSFENLPWGTYHVHVDYLNATGPFAVVVLGPDNPTKSITFEISDGQVISGTSSIELEQFVTVYPNPIRDFVYVELSEELNAKQISISEVSGRIVQSGVVNQQGKLTINSQNWNSGIYILNIICEQGTVSKKLIVDK